MDQHIFYRIISKQPKPLPTQLKTSNEFHRSAPFKLYHKTNQTSLTFLSSLIQTQNLHQGKFNPDTANFTSRDTLSKKIDNQHGKRSHSQNPKRQENTQSQFHNKINKKIQQSSSTLKRISKKQNALCNLLGKVEASTTKIQNRVMEDTIHKARTYTIIPTRINAISMYKKKQNEVQLKEDFTNFIGKQSNIGPKDKDKGTVSTTQYIRRNLTTEFSHPKQKLQQKGDLYHFLNTQQPQNKRVKTDSNTHNYPNLSKRMVEMMLKKELGIYSDHFNFVQVGNRKSFKLNTHQ